MIKRILTLVFILSAFASNAQTAEMADSFRQDGKIYVVVAVMGIVFLSIAAVLIFLERRLSKVEKELKDK